jgi:G3E family GTPase
MVAAWQAADVVVLNKTDLATKDWQADCSDVGALGPYFLVA